MRPFGLLIVFTLLVLPFQSSKASDSTTTKLERFAWLAGSAVGLSLFDYVGHSMTKGTPGTVPYRVAQTVFHWGLTYLLYRELGLSTAISFNVIWWTWGLDFMYYGWAQVLNPRKPFENRNWHGLMGNEISWAWWTPLGLLRGGDKSMYKPELVAQSVIGLSIALIIL